MALFPSSLLVFPLAELTCLLVVAVAVVVDAAAAAAAFTHLRTSISRILSWTDSHQES